MTRTKAPETSPVVEAGHIGVHIIDPILIAYQFYLNVNWIDRTHQ